MSNYDASIRISTKINTKSAEVQLAMLENRIVKTADKIDSLHSKMDSLKNTKIPTQEYQEISAQIEKAETKLNKLLEKQEQMQLEGKDNGVAWDRLNKKIEEVSNEIRYAKGDLQDLIDTGKAFTLGSDTEEYVKLGQQLRYAENELSVLNMQHEVLELKLEKAQGGYKRLGNIAKKSFNSIGNILKKANSLIDSFGKHIKETFSKFTKSASGATKSASGFAFSLKNILKYGFGIQSLYALINKLGTAIKEGFSNLYNGSETFKNTVDELKASALTLKNAFAAAFSPFAEIAIPYVQRLLDYMVQLVNIAGQFFAAITGRKMYIRAIKQTTDALEEETKAMNKQLSPLDKLNNFSSEKSFNASAGTDGTMFEEVPIEEDILNIAEKIKDILSKLFEPLKEAWNREGKFVMDSWKYALGEVWKLIKDIGRDFLTVWQQEATVKIFENLLHIIGDIGLVVGNLARNFREAWNENEVGLHILENIRDIIGIIVEHIRNAADATVKWADKLDFYPLLDAFNRFLESLKPVVDSISGVLEDFYTKVLLPLGKWVLEKGLPELLQVFIDFNNKVDWESLRANLAEFWEHLEPFAETVGEGLIIFIGRVSDALADFINSQEFKDFLVTIENWMDSVIPEDVANGLELIAKGLIALKLALLGFGAISAITGILTTIKTFLSFFGAGGGAAGVSGTMLGTAEAASGLSVAISGLATAFAVVSAAVFGWNVGTMIAEKLDLDPKPFKETMQGIKDSFTDGSWKEALKLWGDDIYAAFVTLGERQAEKFGEIKENISKVWSDIKETALEKWNDIKEKLSETWGSIKKTASEKWDSILSTISDTVDKVNEKIDGFISKIKDAIQSVKDFFASGFEKIGGVVSGWIDNLTSRSSKSSTYSTASTFSTYRNPTISALSEIPIPAYATGQVIPRTMKQHLAILGDNNRETEVVSPISTMKQAFVEALAEVGVVGGNNNNSGCNTYEFSVDGQVFFRIMEKYADEYKKQHGGKLAFS